MYAANPIFADPGDYYTKSEIDEKMLGIAVTAGKRMDLLDSRIKGLIGIFEERGQLLGKRIDEEKAFRIAILDYLEAKVERMFKGHSFDIESLKSKFL